MHPAMKQDELFERIINAHLVVQPSWTDISPNLIYECLALGIPFLVTEKNYMPIRDEIPMAVNPHSVDDIKEKIEYLENSKHYNEYTNQLSEISFSRRWDDVTDEHEKVFNQILS
jgi:SOS-response transcriptional repressor LexA